MFHQTKNIYGQTITVIKSILTENNLVLIILRQHNSIGNGVNQIEIGLNV